MSTPLGNDRRNDWRFDETSGSSLRFTHQDLAAYDARPTLQALWNPRRRLTRDPCLGIIGIPFFINFGGSRTIAVLCSLAFTSNGYGSRYKQLRQAPSESTKAMARPLPRQGNARSACDADRLRCDRVGADTPASCVFAESYAAVVALIEARRDGTKRS